MGSSYNLVDEEWMPVVEKGGEHRNVGIAEALCRAHEIVELRDASPLVTVALHRLLIVVLRDALEGPNDLKEWARLWKKGELPQKKLRGYFKRKHDRFDLFHPERPFFQSAKVSSAKTADVAYLFQHLSTGTGINHFSHDYGGMHRACPVCCAKGLVALPAFCTSGGAGLAPSINDRPPVYSLVKGQSLLATLLMSLPVPGITSLAAGKDGPVWEGTSRSGSIGFMEGFTWQPRTVRLVPDENGSGRCSVCGEDTDRVVSRMVFAKGRMRSREASRAWSDPHVPLARSGSKLGPLKSADPFKAVWRHPSFWRTLFRTCALAADDEVGVPILRQLTALDREGSLPADLRLTLSNVALASVPGQLKLLQGVEWRWSLTVGQLVDGACRAGWQRLLDVGETLFETTVRQPLPREARLRAIATFERDAQRVFREHVEHPELLSADAAISRMQEAAERAFDLALPAQGAYSARGGKRNRAVLVNRHEWAVREAAREGGAG